MLGLNIRGRQYARKWGEGRWNAPTLVLAPANATEEAAETANGKAYLGSARAIAKYFAARFGIPVPRGS